MSKFDSAIMSMEQNLSLVKGEAFNFASNGKKKSAALVRKSLLNIIKTAKAMRAEVQDTKKALPTHRRNMSQETKNKMAASRAARRAAKAPKVAKAPAAVTA